MFAFKVIEICLLETADIPFEYRFIINSRTNKTVQHKVITYHYGISNMALLSNLVMVNRLHDLL